MDIRNRHALKQYAHTRLAEQGFPPRRLALLHAGVSAVCLLAVSALNYLLSHKVAGTAGLSGMGLRSVLQTVQMVLHYAANIALPFWQMGFVFAAITMAKGVQGHPRSLTEGFRRFGPVLRLNLLRGLIFALLMIPCAYLSSVIYVFTPSAQNMMALLMPLMESGADMMQMQTALLELPAEQITALAWPLFTIFGVIYLLIAVTLFYRFRLANYLIMDKPGTGALAALMLSSRLTRKNRFALLRLDLSFWWYHALALLAALVCYLDVFLIYAAIDLPVDAATASLLSYILGLGLQTLLFAYAGSHLHTTWAAAYGILLQSSPNIPPRRPSAPWDVSPSDPHI